MRGRYHEYIDPDFNPLSDWFKPRLTSSVRIRQGPRLLLLLPIGTMKVSVESGTLMMRETLAGLGRVSEAAYHILDFIFHTRYHHLLEA